MKGIAINKLGKTEKHKKIKEGDCIFPFKYLRSEHNKCFSTEKGKICATEINPKMYDAFYRLANVYNEVKDYTDAKMAAKNCLSIKRNYAPAYFELGISEKALGNKVAAIDAFENAKKNKDWRKSAEFEINMLKKGL